MRKSKPCKRCGANDRYSSGHCKPCAKENSRKWFKANHDPAKKAEHNRKWRRANPSYQRDPEKARVSGREYSQANSDKINQQRRKRYKARPEKFIANKANRRARKAGNGGSFTDAEWVQLLTHYNNTCLACGRLNAPLTVDHVIPVSCGGVGDISNIQPLCQPCNSKKGTRIIDYRPDNSERKSVRAIVIYGELQPNE